jgi:hypothetical protein
MKYQGTAIFFLAILLIVPTISWSAVVTEHDSTQPRGSATGVYNEQYQPLDPIREGFHAPASRASMRQGSLFHDWAGMTMANATRDPSFYATVSVANKDVINFANALFQTNPSAAIDLLKALKLEKDIAFDPATNRLQPEAKIPVAADLCLRCHSPVGWMEAHSEPPTAYTPFLKGQFWGSAFMEYPGHRAPITVTGSYPNEQYVSYTGLYLGGTPHKVNVMTESEAEMDGIQCDFCHRTKDNYKRYSRYDGKAMVAGSGGFFVDRSDIFGSNAAWPAYDIQRKAEFCGTCHDVTNPIFDTKTVVNGTVPTAMKHPIERTYTEWYWSAYRNDKKCQDCHRPMKFPAAQTWLLYPGLDKLWGPVDQIWNKSPYSYGVSSTRTTDYKNALARNQSFMKTAATLSWAGSTKSSSSLSVKLKITNNTGHKLPTGFAEGRQMWVYLKAVDAAGKVVFEDGVIDATGHLVRTANTKVYEQAVLAKGYENLVLDGINILDADKDGTVTHEEKEFHFVLMNYIEKDNRIPPKGFNKAAYQADGAFIVPRDPGDTDYPSGQNWDVITYTIPLATTPKYPVTVIATLKYQTFNKEYIDFLDRMDTELTVKNGGRARNIPDAGIYGSYQTWGDVLKAIWTASNKGQPVTMATSSTKVY